MISRARQATGFNFTNLPMSTSTENNANGFTAVNDRSIQSLAVKALGHKEYPHSNGDAAPAYQPYPATAPHKKRTYHEVISSPEQPRSRTLTEHSSISPVTASAFQRALEQREQDSRPSQADPLSRDHIWNGAPSMDEARMAELLTESTASHSEPTIDGSPGRLSHPQGDLSTPKDQNGDTDNTPLITNAGLQVDMKKRKRAFTNRTKTGCQTCRKRKKKCDEGKPACNNCIRGGFTCLGYVQKRDVQKQSPTLGRALNAHIAPAAAPARDHWESSSTRSTPRGPNFDQNSLPVGMQEPRSNGLVNEPDHLRSWSSPNFYPNPRPVGQDRPSLPPPFPSRDLPMSGSMQTSYSPMIAARRALAQPDSHFSSHSMGSSLDQEPRLNQTKFQPTEMLYTRHRKDCRKAVAELNQALSDKSNDGEVQRRLRLVVMPIADTDGPKPKGKLGKDVWVEAPLHVDYGYNLHIGDKVFIDKNCTFKDAGEIIIGDNTRIGPNTTISAELMMYDGPWQSFSKQVAVRIGKNCVIAGNCAIYAPDKLELVIGDNVYIAPGVTICADVPHNSRVYRSVRSSSEAPPNQGFMGR